MLIIYSFTKSFKPGYVLIPILFIKKNNNNNNNNNKRCCKTCFIVRLLYRWLIMSKVKCINMCKGLLNTDSKVICFLTGKDDTVPQFLHKNTNVLLRGYCIHLHDTAIYMTSFALHHKTIPKECT